MYFNEQKSSKGFNAKPPGDLFVYVSKIAKDPDEQNN
jgi:hypothetical protein